ncbi:MAG: KpsF/GutQ family sugar-phosphate isomerase [candidate division KSB1 bacterium]|nr:KpsF/GutQ family sugar-phosphate isomerase [candidate division KSB1 bacterium]
MRTQVSPLPVSGEEAARAIAAGRRVLEIETRAVQALVDRVGESFVRAVDLLCTCRGRVIVTGMGKSGIIASKIAATLTSTGTAAIFMHAAEAVHGELGLVRKDDVVIFVSKSGNTGELTRLFPALRRIGVPIISIIGNLRSALAERSDVVLDVSVEEEACPNGLAPTASSTAALAMGDALAVAVLERRHFGPEDFAFLHPGGSLGKKLRLKVDDVMFTGEHVAKVQLRAPLREAILEITRKRFGGTCVVDEQDVLRGIITDGDLRRLMEKDFDIRTLTAADVMNDRPKTVPVGAMAIDVLRVMEDFNILQIVVVDPENHPVGMIHLHDLLEAGVS